MTEKCYSTVLILSHILCVSAIEFSFMHITNTGNMHLTDHAFSLSLSLSPSLSLCLSLSVFLSLSPSPFLFFFPEVRIKRH